MDRSNAELVRDAFAAWAAGRGSFYDLLHPDAVWTIPGISPHCGVWRGREAFLSEIVHPFLTCFSTFGIEVNRIWADGDTVAVHWHSHGTDRDGQPYANAYVYIIELRDGAAVALTAFLDMAAFNALWNKYLPHS